MYLWWLETKFNFILFNKFELVNGATCSRIFSYYNIIELNDSYLNTNLTIETALYSYSFKLSAYDENILYTNIVKINSEPLQSMIDLENCKMVDTLTRVNEIIKVIDGIPCQTNP